MSTIRATLVGVIVAPGRSVYRCSRCGITRPYRPGRIITLRLGEVLLMAIAQDEDGRRVTDPGNNPEKVVRLDIVDVQSERRSGAEVAT